MKKIFVFILALSLAIFLHPSIEHIRNETELSSQCKKIIIKNGKFPEDYTCTVNGVKLAVKKGSSYKGYLQIKKALEETEPCFSDGLAEVIFTTENVLIASGQFTAEEIIEKNLPEVGGTYGVEDGNNVIYIHSYTDPNLVLGLYTHELLHHIVRRERVLGNDICNDAKSQKYITQIKTYDYEKDKYRKYFDTYDEEVIVAATAFSYVDYMGNYPKIVREACPELKAHMGKWFNDIRERYEEES